MKKIIFILFIAVSISALAQKVLPAEIQIKTALLACPSDKREGAKVYGYSPEGNFIVLREGKNDMVSIADNPKQTGISVSCYYYKLEPFMARGRELQNDGKSFQEKFDAREAEVKAGKLIMPDEPAILFAVQGLDENYNSSTGDLKDSNMRYVIYIPYATAASTGLPVKPDVPGMPWIMDPGTHRAHIMITPPAPSPEKKKEEEHKH